MNRLWRYAVIGTLVFILLASNIFGASKITDSNFELAEKASLYALPLVITDLTRQAMEVIPNRFYHTSILANHTFRTVLGPNVDTLYSYAWLDLAAGPVLLKMPPSNGRYFMIQCLDAWTNVFADPGIRTLGDKGATYAIVGPHWQSKLPEGAEVIHAPTQMVWVIGRVYVRNQADLSPAQAFQNQLDIRPLCHLNDPSFQSIYPDHDLGKAANPSLMETLATMKPKTFFEQFLKLTVTNPPVPQDTSFVNNILTPLGLTPGKPRIWESIAASKRRALEIGFECALQEIKSGSIWGQYPSLTPTGWSNIAADKSLQGNYGTEYQLRAAAAVYAPGINLSIDAIYLSTIVDANRKPLDGSKKYYLKFAAGSTPPARGFWSFTIYDRKGYLVANPINRYAIKSGDDLLYEADGSLVIYLQPNDIGPGHNANWLPTPEGQTFMLTLRAYWPEKELLEGEWMPPAVEPAQ